MRPKSSIILAVALLVVAVGVGIFAAAKPSRDADPAPASTRPSADETVGPPGGAGERDGVGAPSGDASRAVASRRPLSLDGAMRSLELIRPPRRKAADDFVLPAVGGGTFRLATHRGKPVLVNFWATWCPPCVKEMPALERLWRRHRDSGFMLVAVSVDADPRVVLPFVSDLGLTFPIALDTDMQTAQAYGVRALPSTFLVDRGGDLAAFALGPRHWDNAASHALVEAMVR